VESDAVLLSMTGFGSGQADANGTTATVEIRSVNNRHLKITVRGSDPYPLLEADFEKLIRKSTRRGTVTIAVRVERPDRQSQFLLNADAVASYLAQLSPVLERLPPNASAAILSGLLTLPGVSPEERTSQAAPEDEWPLVEKASNLALAALTKTRATEGRMMADELLALTRQITERIDAVKAHYPTVVADYRKRLHDRISQAVNGTGVAIDETNLIREIALYADRTDVAEEITRLTGHIAAVEEVVRTGGEGAGRRLEFLAQEMGREANTLGSKAGDAVVTRHAVEIKALLEKFRELVLNIE
jgi:uncharacterized protein (TIGR00255 family)